MARQFSRDWDIDSFAWHLSLGFAWLQLCVDALYPIAMEADLENLTPEQLKFLLVLLLSFALLVSERIRPDVVGLLIILALYATGTLNAAAALSGFSSEPAIIAAAIFVLTAALHQTGMAETIGGWIVRVAGKNYSRMLAVMMPAVALLSAFTHHLTMTAVMIPVATDLARQNSVAPSKLLMPVSFAASLGTTITIIGAPAFIVASGVLKEAGFSGLGIFSITPIGLAITVAGTAFVLAFGRFLLPVRQAGVDQAERFRLDNYFTEVVILADSAFAGKSFEEIEEDKRFPMRIVGWVRDGRPLRRPFSGRKVEEGDVLLVRAAPEEIATIRQQAGIELHPVAQYGRKSAPAGEAAPEEDFGELLVQAIVAPTSELIGRSIAEIDFRRRYGVIVISMWRRQGWFDRELAHTRLLAGDVLVFQGEEEAIRRIRVDPAFLMMVPFQGEARLPGKAKLAAAILGATVVIAGAEVMALEMAILAGAAAAVLFGCVTSRQAYRAIDARIYVFIAGAIPLGMAMQQTGTAELAAEWIYRTVSGWPEFATLLVIFAVVSVITQFMSDAATTALFAPVAVSLAKSLGHSPEAYAVTVAMAAVASVLTPIGHHGNLLIYAPGGYRFLDFVKVGTPLTVVIAIVVCWLAPLIWAGRAG
jgi:di/tricarboxylate transporter